jgi:chlorite dismutase
MEWGVTLFARTTSEIKAIVYEMRFDEVSARYAEFGEFFIGIQMEVPDLCNRLNL